MKIGLNLLYMIPGVVGGTETYAKGLLRGLKELRPDHEFVIFLNRESSELALDDGPGFKTVVCPVNAVRRKDRYYFEQVRLRRFLKDNGIDLLHSLGYTSPRFLPCPTVVSVPDLNFKAFGDTMPLARRLMLGLFVRQALIHSNKVITISEFSRREIQREYKIPQKKIVVTYLAADLSDLDKESEEGVEDSTPLPGTSRPYIIAFSSSYANKNIPRLIEAFREAKKNNRLDQKLVLIGHRYQAGEDGQGAGAQDDNRDVIWTGYVDRRRLFKVLKGADFLVFPSLYEGFGLPVLESMAVGVPVLCSRAASLPEVADEAALFFDPLSVKDLKERIVLLANDFKLRETLRQKGYENLKRFSWRKTAAETIAVYEDVWRDRSLPTNRPHNVQTN